MVKVAGALRASYADSMRLWSSFAVGMALATGWSCAGSPSCPASKSAQPPHIGAAPGATSEGGSPSVASPANSLAAERVVEVPIDRARWKHVNLGEHFEAEGVVGAFVGYDPASGYGWIHAAELAKVGYLPASTFKIANSIIALESGVVSDADFEIPWDGERRWNADWNYDATLKKAFRYSVVPYYQAVARRVGAQRMQDWLERLEYGNRDMSGALDTFWLRGGLRISALEQVDFLQRMNTGRLPISERTRGIVREIMFFGKRGHVRLHAKTGSTGPVEDGTSVGWFVGWVERDEARFYFATLLIDPPQKAWSARMHVSDRILVALGRLPGRPGAESD